VRPDSPSWTAADRDGRALEDRLAAYFRARGFDALRNLGDAPAFDVELRALIECKADRLAARTGRVAIETAYRGRPSGLSTTRAGFYVVEAAGSGLWIPTPALRALVEAGEFEERDGGDGGRSRLTLVPLETLTATPGVRVLWGGE
jgi:hypothetical protein